jgi:hypothetical protein
LLAVLFLEFWSSLGRPPLHPMVCHSANAPSSAIDVYLVISGVRLHPGCVLDLQVEDVMLLLIVALDCLFLFLACTFFKTDPIFLRI